jgi:uncharacterized protein
MVPSVLSKEYNLPLLAVKETSNGTFQGSSADLYLEIQNGQGRVFLDTYPLTKLDTQMSTRFAKEIACSQIDFNCDNYDFIYTIKSNSVIVGGPSAGAAITLLTIAALKNIDLKENITITGTINSGGIIGSVGGLKEKIDAASSIGLKKVLIPNGEIVIENENISNATDKNASKIDLLEYGKKLGIEVIEVPTIKDALYHLSGIDLKEENRSLEINKKYQETMIKVTEDLCKRSSELKNNIKNMSLDDDEKQVLESIENLTKKSIKAFENEKYYSSASYCFGANTKLSYLLMKNSNMSRSEILTKITEIKSKIKKMNNELNNISIKTITDLETYMVVKERLDEAEESVDKVINLNNDTEKISDLAYSLERLNSAESWSNFFEKGDKEFFIGKEELQSSCINKIYEAEERNEYLKLITSMNFDSTNKAIDSAKKDLEDEKYELCLFKASKAKADSDVILNTIGSEESQLLEITEQRLDVIKNNLIKEQKKGIFPVIGYSYYEYANDLKENDIYSSMLFTEYSLELSNLDIYFKNENKPKLRFNYDIRQIIGILIVFISGILVGLSLSGIKNKNKK